MIYGIDKEKISKEFAAIKVTPLDMKKLNADIDKSIKKELKKAKGSSLVPKVEIGEEFYVRGSLGLLVGTDMLIDDECIGFNRTSEVTLEIFSHTKDKKGQVVSFGMCARFTTKTTIAELLKDYGKKEVSLETHMKDRFAYNDRIVSNMYRRLNELKPVTKLP